MLIIPSNSYSAVIVTTDNGRQATGVPVVANSVTISTPLGTAGKNVVVVYGAANGSGIDVGTIACSGGGGTWTNIAQILNNNGGTGASVAFFTSTTSSGGSQNLTFSASTLRGAATAGSWSLSGALNLTIYSTAIQVGTTDGSNATGNINYPAGGCVLAASSIDPEGTASTPTWSGTAGVVLDGTTTFESGNGRKLSMAHLDEASAGSTKAVTVAWSGSPVWAMGLVAVSFTN